MLLFLSKPYPAPDAYDYRTALSKAFIAGLVVTTVLTLFEPFGLDKVGFGNKYLVYLGYGAITFLAVVLVELVLIRSLPSVFTESKWVVGKEIILQLFVLLSVGLFNGIFNTLTAGATYNLGMVGRMMINTAIVGICPMAALVIADYFRLNSKFAAQSDLIESNISSRQANDTPKATPPSRPAQEKIVLSGKNEGEQLELFPEELYFVGAQANYVTIHHLYDGTLTKTLFRTTLNNIEEKIQGQEGIIRCHRSGIVNLNHVIKTSGNAQGLKLNLAEYQEQVLVSRKYVPTVRKHFQQ